MARGLLEGFGLREDVETGVAPTPHPDNIADGCPYHLYIGDKPINWLQCGMWYQYLPGQLHADEKILYYSRDSDIPITAERLPGLLHSDGKIWFFGDVPLTSETDMPETVQIVYQRGRTVKDDGTLLNLGAGGDAFTLPSDWVLKKRLTLISISEGGTPPNEFKILRIMNHFIPEIRAITLVDFNYVVTGNVQCGFNPETGVFPATANNNNIDYILLVEESE